MFYRIGKTFLALILLGAFAGCVTRIQAPLHPGKGLALLPEGADLYFFLNRKGNEDLLRKTLETGGVDPRAVDEMIRGAHQLLAAVKVKASETIFSLILLGKFRKNSIEAALTSTSEWKRRQNPQTGQLEYRSQEGWNITLPAHSALYVTNDAAALRQLLDRRRGPDLPMYLPREVNEAFQRASLGLFAPGGEANPLIKEVLPEGFSIPIRYTFLTANPREEGDYALSWVFRTINDRKARAIERALRLFLITWASMDFNEIQDLLSQTRIASMGSKTAVQINLSSAALVELLSFFIFVELPGSFA